MKVVVAQSAGFCWGVRRAVETARKTADSSKQTVFTDGPLIHNSHMVNRLEAGGVRECNDPASLPPDSTLIVRAHGIPPERRRYLESLPLHLVDATCPDVARIQRIIRENTDLGKTVLILGDPGHAEVVGLLGYAGSRGRVVTSPRDVEALPADLEKVCLVSQSTQAQQVFDDTAEAVVKRFPQATIIRTICTATRNRQAELETLASQCDAFVVVGSKASANTQRLAQLAATRKPTFVVDSAEELRPEDFLSFTAVAVTAGASTPDFMISQVTDRLATFGSL